VCRTLPSTSDKSGSGVIKHSDLGKHAEGVAVVAGNPVTFGGDDVVGQGNAHLRGRLHQVAATVRIQLILGQQRTGAAPAP
jgi:hypothetical protein